MNRVAAKADRSVGRNLLWVGLALPVATITVYAALVSMAKLSTPWFLPIGSTIGAILCLAALWQRRTIWRVLALIVVVVLAGAEWTFLFATRLPAYSGPVIVGKPFPEFATFRADGSPFTQNELLGNQLNVLVFFRGRW